MAKLPDGTSQEELYEKAKDRMWKIEAVYELDKKEIMEWLEASANEAIIVKPGETKEDIKKHAMEQYPSLSKQLLGLYKIDKKKFHAQLLQDAGEGVFKQRTPPVISVWLWCFFFGLAAFFELGLFSYLVFYKGAGYGLLGLGLVLFLGGLVAGGKGLTPMMTHGKEMEYLTNKNKKVERKHIGYLIVGLILIAGVVALRGIYGGAFAGVIAAFFGLLVMATETIFLYNHFLRKHYMDLMYRAQEYHAANALAEDLGDPKDHTDDVYYPIFEAKIDKGVKLLERKK